MPAQVDLNRLRLKRIPDPKPLVMNQYLLLREIGRGCYGIVYSAKDKDTHRIVAVKKHNTRDNAPYALEAGSLRRIGHLKYFPTLIECGMFRGRAYIAMSMEGADMVSIAQYSRLKKLGKRNLLKFIYHATKAVDALHRETLVHRDIKPDNFVIGKSSNKAPIVLLDFGHAQFFLRGFRIPDANFLNVVQAPPQILRGGPYTTMADWFLVAISVLALAGYKKPNVPTSRYHTPQERADFHDARHTGFQFELYGEDKYLVPILEKFYTPGVDEFDMQSVLELVMAEEEFDAEEPLIVEEEEVQEL